MGLGLLGGALNDIHFLYKHGASLLVTDLKSSTELRPSLQKLQKYKNIEYVLEEHRLEDFKNADMVLQPGNVPEDSPYLAEAKKNNIPIFVSESLFAYCASDVFLIGITGTRGKSTVTELIYHILKSDRPRVFLGGNVKNVSTLNLLDKARPRDTVVLEMDSWALHGMGNIKKSPQVSIFTNFLDDHLNYYKGDRNKYFEDKANIFKYQNKDNVLIIGKQVVPFLEKLGGKIRVKPIVAPEKINGFSSNLLGSHNEYNVALAITAARILGVKDSVIRKAVKSFKGIEGRLELVREIRGVKYYNDTTATTPDATIAALKALGELRGKSYEPGRKVSNNQGRTLIGQRKTILIMGGTDKGLDMNVLIKEIPKYCKILILLKGNGTDRLTKSYELGAMSYEVDSLKKAIKVAGGWGGAGGFFFFFSPGWGFFFFGLLFYKGGVIFFVGI